MDNEAIYKLAHGIFLGKDSCGFKNNKMYCVKIERKTGSKHIWIRDMHSAAKCPYNSMYAIFLNWHLMSNHLVI